MGFKQEFEAREHIEYHLILYRIYGCLLFVSAFSLKSQDTINLSKQGIISADSNIDTGMDLGTTLSV